ncbi:unnamed protein product, partial [Rotaria sp. Silwood2]
EAFSKVIGYYLQREFQKRVYSFFQSIKVLYITPEKVQIIDSLRPTYLNNLTKYETFEASTGMI